MLDKSIVAWFPARTCFDPVTECVRTATEFFRPRLVSTLLIVMTTIASAAADDPPDSADASFVRDAILDNLGRITSGDYSANGRYRMHDRAEKDSWEFDEVIQCQFDHIVDRLRFVRSRDRVAGSPSILDHFFETSFIVDADRVMKITSMHSRPAQYTAGIHLMTSPVDAEPYFQPIIDIRSLSLVQFRHLAWSLDDLRPMIDAMTQTDDDTTELILLQIEGDERIDRWWSDPDQGFQIVRYTRTNPRPEFLDRLSTIEDPDVRAQLEASLKINEPVTVSSTNWENRHEVWVPKSYHLVTRERNIDHELSLDFNWESVNEPLDDAMFDWEQWALADGSRVVDMRLGHEYPVTLKVYGEPTEFPIEHTDSPTGIPWRRLFFITNLMVIGFLIGWGIQRWRRSLHHR